MNPVVWATSQNGKPPAEQLTLNVYTSQQKGKVTRPASPTGRGWPPPGQSARFAGPAPQQRQLAETLSECLQTHVRLRVQEKQLNAHNMQSKKRRRGRALYGHTTAAKTHRKSKQETATPAVLSAGTHVHRPGTLQSATSAIAVRRAGFPSRSASRPAAVTAAASGPPTRPESDDALRRRQVSESARQLA